MLEHYAHRLTYTGEKNIPQPYFSQKKAQVSSWSARLTTHIQHAGDTTTKPKGVNVLREKGDKTLKKKVVSQ